MTIRAIIWDVGGVLVRTLDYTARQSLAQSLGISHVELENIVFSIEAQLGQISLEEHWERIRQHFNLTPEAMIGFHQKFWDGDRLDSKLVASIYLLQIKYKTGLLSNALPGLRSTLINEWRIADAFDVMIISSEVGLMKPDPRIYQLVVSALGVQADEAVFIDDFAHNIAGAKASGLHAIHFRTPDQTVAELEKLLSEKNSQSLDDGSLNRPLHPQPL